MNKLGVWAVVWVGFGAVAIATSASMAVAAVGGLSFDAKNILTVLLFALVVGVLAMFRKRAAQMVLNAIGSQAAPNDGSALKLVNLLFFVGACMAAFAGVVGVVAGYALDASVLQQVIAALCMLPVAVREISKDVVEPVLHPGTDVE